MEVRTGSAGSGAREFQTESGGRLNFFEKPIDQITKDDLDWLISSEVREGQQVEFKRELSGDATPDAWQSGGKVGNTAVTALVKEIVAFANAQGGVLVLGVDESEDKPSRAQALRPIRDATELAEVLKIRCLDNIEPTLYGIEVAGIATDSAEGGCVVIRVQPSPYAPHRSLRDLKCYLRSNDRSVPMSMNDIQRRGLETAQRYEHGEAWFKKRVPGTDIAAPGYIMRVVARPLGPVFLPKVHRNELARPKFKTITIRGNDVKYEGLILAEGLNWSPRVRGTGFTEKVRTGALFQCDIGEDGTLFFDWRHTVIDQERFLKLAIHWFIGMFGNLLLAVERLRLAAQSATDYEAEFHLVAVGCDFLRVDYGNRLSFDAGSTFPQGLNTLGRYPIGAPDTFDALTRQFETDVYHLTGDDNPDNTSFDYSASLAEMRSSFGLK